jgi:lipid-binding SYLF domain-containing protein
MELGGVCLLPVILSILQVRTNDVRLFMTDEAFKKLRASKGWEAGVDGNLALITVGGGERAVTTTSKDPIVGFVFDAKGLIADISLKGVKFSKVNKKE